MKKIAGPIRTELAQYRELAAFAQFGSELDDDTRERLAQGERIKEVLKQPQYQPLAVEKQIVIIYAVTRKYLLDVPVERIAEFEKGLYEFVELNMASMRDIKRRKESIQSTQQITKAMKLVSTVKLQKAKTRAESAKPYFQKMYDTVQSILSRSGNIEHPYLTSNGSKKKAVIVVTSNRGLAGGYNNNIVKLVAESGLPKESVEVYGIGKKGIESFERKGYYIASDDSEIINAPLFSDAVEIGRKVLDAYEAGEVGEIYLAYTSFKNTVVHTPEFIKLLPVEVKEEESADKKSEAPMNYEPEAEESLDLLIPKYINSIVYGAFIEAVASENGARMQAMDAATSNAEDMISTLSLAYNRARQGAITQELTEIISGAEALN